MSRDTHYYYDYYIVYDYYCYVLLLARCAAAQVRGCKILKPNGFAIWEPAA